MNAYQVATDLKDVSKELSKYNRDVIAVINKIYAVCMKALNESPAREALMVEDEEVAMESLYYV